MRGVLGNFFSNRRCAENFDESKSHRVKQFELSKGSRCTKKAAGKLAITNKKMKTLRFFVNQ